MSGLRGLLLVSLLVLLVPGAAHAGGGRYIVRFSDEARGRSALQAAGATVVLDLPPQAAVAALIPDEALDGLRRNPHFALVERDPERFPLAQSVPYGIDLVQAPLVWSQATGTGRKVCLIDSGFYVGHEDLQTSNLTGYPSTWRQDGCGHGTHVGGTMAALDNSVGVVGVLPGGISLHVVRVFGDDCSWSYASDLIDALNHCRSAGAHVVNMSLGGDDSSWIEELAFDQAYREGMLLVAAAGNDGSARAHYPASYDSVISVAAVDESKEVASFSQRNDQVEFAAPGVAVVSTVPWADGLRLAPGSGYLAWSGTSMATPHVTGVAALIWSYNPTWTNDQIRRALQATAEDLGPVGRDPSYGYGLVRARAALDYLTAAVDAPPRASFTFSCSGLSCSFVDTSTDDRGVVGWQWEFGDGSRSSERNPTHLFAAGGSYSVSLTVRDAAGSTDAAVQTVSVAASGAFTLTARAYKVRSSKRVDLAWSGASAASVDVYRNGRVIATTPNDGAYTDSLPEKRGGTFTYQVCDAGTAVCSNAASVVF